MDNTKLTKKIKLNNKRKIYKFRLSKFYEEDVLGTFFKKRKIRDYKLKKIGYIFFLEQLQCHFFQFVRVKIDTTKRKRW
jgi:hypothetical protein